MLVLKCIHCNSRNLEQIINEDGFAEFKCKDCNKSWNIYFEIVEKEDKMEG